jgi:predicted outer membrane protein
MSFYNFLTLVLAIAAVAGVIVWGLGGKSRQNTNDAIVQENASLRNQLGDERAAKTALEVRVAKAEKNEEFAKSIALGKPDYEKLSVQLTEQHKQLLNAFTSGTNKMAAELGKLAKTIAADRKR